MTLTVLAIHLILPAVYVAMLWRDRALSRARWASSLFLSGSYVLFIVIVGAWHWPSHVLRGAIIVAWLAVAVTSRRRARRAPLFRPKSWRSLLGTGFQTALGGVFLVMALYGVAGYGTDAPAVELEFPLNDGLYAVGHGGSVTLINYHRTYEPQAYALDILKLNRFGARAFGWYPDDLGKYAIYGDKVHSPCAGSVVWVRDGLPDQQPGQMNPKQPEGNGVAVECKGVVVYLAHFQKDSLMVRQGDVVRAGQVVGRVGNSGNTSEPHLHIHAEQGRYAERGSPKRGVPLRFSGRFLVRNSLVWSKPTE